MALVRFNNGSTGSVTLEGEYDGMQDNGQAVRDERRMSLRAWVRRLRSGYAIGVIGMKQLGDQLAEELDEADRTKEDTA